MIQINLNDDLSTEVERLAKKQHRPVQQLINIAIITMLEEYNDIQNAEETLLRIERGKEKTYSLDEVEQYINDLDS